MNGQAERTARAVAQRAATALEAHVSVSDEAGQLICEASPGYMVADGGSQPMTFPLSVAGIAGCISVDLRGSQPASHRVVQGYLELLMRDVVRSEVTSEEQELRSAFVLNLLRGDVLLDPEIIRYGEVLGMDLARPRAAIVVRVPAYILGCDERSSVPDAARSRARRVIASLVSFFRLPSDAICTYIGEGEVALLKASTPQDLDPWSDRTTGQPGRWADLQALKLASDALLKRLHAETGCEVTVGVGRYHGGRRALALSYRDARAALSLGDIVRGGGVVHCLDELGIAALAGLGDRRTQVELAHHLLSPLDAEPGLQQTLAAFFKADCSMTETAECLGIHRNTLTYRLQKIASLTGLDPRKFDEAVQIRLAVELKGLDGNVTPERPTTA